MTTNIMNIINYNQHLILILLIIVTIISATTNTRVHENINLSNCILISRVIKVSLLKINVNP
jgi:hypothetical protein